VDIKNAKMELKRPRYALKKERVYSAKKLRD
jgi:hypothetical protein